MLVKAVPIPCQYIISINDDFSSILSEWTDRNKNIFAENALKGTVYSTDICPEEDEIILYTLWRYLYFPGFWHKQAKRKIPSSATIFTPVISVKSHITIFPCDIEKHKNC